MLLSLVFPSLDRAAKLLIQGPKRSVSFLAPLFNFSKAEAKAGTATD